MKNKVPSVSDIVAKKADGGVLDEVEIRTFVKAVYDKSKGIDDNIGDHQIGALLMAIRINNMTDEETYYLTKYMAQFSQRFNWSSKSYKELVVDKHSTGGVGDKVSHILVPILAACGAKVPMISGRGLDITGGTIDKLESIKGFQCDLSDLQKNNLMDTVGAFICAQSSDIAPVDKILYKYRNETGTVPSYPLITSSIISKKYIEDLGALLLDVKYGKAAFMKNQEGAEKLAQLMINVSNQLNVKASAFITNMDNVLGNCVGNALEIVETLNVLRNEKCNDHLKGLVTSIAKKLLQFAMPLKSETDIEQQIEKSLSSGAALLKFEDLLIGQGVKNDLAKQLCSPNATIDSNISLLIDFNDVTKMAITSTKEGYIKSIDAFKIGSFVVSLGGGKKDPSDVLNYSVGVVFQCQIGEWMNEGDTIADVYYVKHSIAVTQVSDLINDAVTISTLALANFSIIAKVIE